MYCKVQIINREKIFQNYHKTGFYFELLAYFCGAKNKFQKWTKALR